MAEGTGFAVVARSGDRAADVLRAAGPAVLRTAPSSPLGQERLRVRRVRPSGGAASAALPLARPSAVRAHPVPDVLRAAGQPLAAPLRAEMEGRFGTGFSDVRVHTGSAARASAAEVGARAYTYGSHLVIGDGGAGKHTLAHELAHVVQQRSGAVTSGFQHAGVGVSDPADSFEREADAAAQRVAAGHPAGIGPVEEDVPGRPALPRGPGVVQRKVGFEFQTGWGIEKKGLFGLHPLKKTDQVGTGKHDGFKIEADEAGGGLSEIEFIVYPPVDEGLDGMKTLNWVMSWITNFGMDLESQAGRAGFQPFPLSSVTDDAGDGKFIVTPESSHKIEGRPQVTTGLDLAKIGHLRRRAAHRAKPPREMDSSVDALAKGAADVSDRIASSRIGMRQKLISAELQGLLTVITTYLARGAFRWEEQDVDLYGRHDMALNYPKRIGDLLLARTDFAGLFERLPQDEQAYYAKNPMDFVRLVLAALDPHLGIKEDSQVIARGIQKSEDDPTKGITFPGPTVGDWLYGIPHGFDSLTGNDMESMGEFGSRTEKVGPGATTGAGTAAGIFEIRGTQEHLIPLKRWSGFAAESLAFITAVHGG